MKKVLVILLAVVMIAGLAACGNKDDGAASSPAPGASTAPTTSTAPAPAPAPANPTASGSGVLVPGEIIEADESDDVKYADSIDILTEMNISTVDPYSTGGTSSACRVTYQMVYDRLTYFNTNTNEVVPELATSWETDDVQTFIFHLRDDVVFHNGDKFTAEDVVYSHDVAMENPGSLAFDQWRAVTEMTIIDPYTIKIVIQAPDSSFAYNLALPGGAIINKRAREADPVTGAWVGTGAFYVSGFDSDNYTELTRNDNYWGELPKTRVLNLRFIPEVASRAVMLLNGGTDVCLSVGPTDMPVFVDNPDFIIYGYAANTTHSLTFSMINPITSDLNFRLAVAHALNRQEIALVSTGIWAKPTEDGSFWGDSTPYRNTDIPLLEYDIEKAKDYLAKSVYNGEVMTLITGPDTLALGGEMMVEQMRVIGINVEQLAMDVPSLVPVTMYGDPNMQMLHFVGPFELDPSSARVMLYPEMSANRASYNNPEVNELLDKVLGIADVKEVEAIYKQIQLLVSYDIPQLSLYERIWTIVTNPRVGGININVDMNHDLRGIFMTEG